MSVKTEEQIPTDVYLSFVRSLYGNRMTLFAGMLAHVAISVVIYIKVGDPAYLYFGGAIFLNWLSRWYSMRIFDRSDLSENDRSKIAMWEKLSIAGGGMTAFLLGLMCGYAFLVTGDTFAQIAVLSVTLSLLVSVVGRNFGTKITVYVVTLAACMPIMLSLILVDNPYMMVLAALMIPLAVTTISMANGVREFLYDNVMSHREIAVIAEQFDSALNNMPHGLLMLNEDGRVLVTNRKAVELIGLPDRTTLLGHTLGAILRYGVNRGALSTDRAVVIRAQLDSLIAGRRSRALIDYSDNLYLEFTAKRRSNKGVVLIFENVTSRIVAEEKIVHMARFDQLTGLPNRGYFAEIVEKHLRDMSDDSHMALVVLDLDDFKHVNDTNGHSTGDRLLCALSSRLSGFAGDAMTLSRFGGDEFVIFIRDVRDQAHIEQIMADMFSCLRGTYLINGSRLFVSLSAGVVLARKFDFRLDMLHIKADLALYESKHREKNVWTIFAEEMDQKYSELQSLKAALRDAVRNRSFSVVYQPMFALNTMKVTCCEALSRWYHPDFGSVSPATYIPLAEEMGIVGELTRQMLHMACLDCARWDDEVSVSVNLSANDLRNEEILDLVQEALDAAGLDPSRLEVEVTESALVRDSEKAKLILEKLRARGVSISIDDFGTGYSGLSYLHLLPLNKVKIDRSFISDITSNSRTLKLLKGVVHLSRELGLEIVVEGVETEEQLELIRTNECADLLQGFIFGVPMSADSVTELVTNLQPKAGSSTPGQREMIKS